MGWGWGQTRDSAQLRACEIVPKPQAGLVHVIAINGTCPFGQQTLWWLWSLFLVRLCPTRSGFWNGSLTDLDSGLGTK